MQTAYALARDARSKFGRRSESNSHTGNDWFNLPGRF